ncbi:MAG: APC family permease [Candidatus Binatus sp.]|uniref:APC family permease n=1 Tax=Candidatus Binatus sp. TaxID=2811406 RepID=UPI00271E8E89|nr:APC family permease [Candidatus Binatus sp.]MDO8434202.1 APC family permease [Candidatus Binatus sp.]
MPIELVKDSRDESNRGKRTLTKVLIGPARDVRDPQTFHSLSLIAFLAWVGLGSDGLSSSCYGPEEAFLALGSHQYLAVFLALLMALTVFIISASYSQTIDQFPTGGGGYLVATKLLGTYPGLVSGCALIVDYVLTVAISIASGADAIFSFLPVAWLPYKFWLAFGVVVVMVAMNLRGVKESVLALVPIFLAFVGLHSILIVYAFLSHAGDLPVIGRDAMQQARQGFDTLGIVGLAIVFFRAYSMGAGTYTGIEAVSNGLPILREPRAVTGKRTMLYMALSLAFIAGGILVAYLLAGVEPQHGKTLNAVLFERLTEHWTIGGLSLGMPIVTMTLLTEGALLFVAAQTGFVGGPQVLATMATDRWVPRRFANLSERLVTQDGVVAMGLAALLVLIGTRASVRILVILYAINVFVTFTLSQLGMSALWWRERATQPQWIRKLLINGVGCIFTALILFLTVTLKFDEGGWVTVAITSAVVAFCYMVRRHYAKVSKAIEQLEADVLPDIFAAKAKKPYARDPRAPTAVLLVNGFNGLGLATLLKIPRLFEGQFHNVVFISVGEFDSSLLKGHDEVNQLEEQINSDALEYCQLAADLGFHAEVKTGLGADVVTELRRLCLEVAEIFPNSVFFAGQLVFNEELDGFFSRFLHNHTAFELLRWLQLQGLSLVILPVRVAGPPPRLSRNRAPSPA